MPKVSERRKRAVVRAWRERMHIVLFTPSVDGAASDDQQQRSVAAENADLLRAPRVDRSSAAGFAGSNQLAGSNSIYQPINGVLMQ